MKRYVTRRNLLHKAKLPEFLAWAEEQGYILHPSSPKAIYEVARLEKYSRSGTNGHIVIYERLDAQHLTLDGEGVHLVQRWLSSRIALVSA